MPVAETDFKFSELDDYIDSLPTKEGSLITVLHKAQELIGYLPTEVQHHIAIKLGVPLSKVYGVVTFYSFFNLKPKGKYKIACCLGTACYVRGVQAISDEFQKQLHCPAGEVTEDMLFSVDNVRCVGACGLAPVIAVNGKLYGRVTTDDVKGLIQKYASMGGDSDA